MALSLDDLTAKIAGLSKDTFIQTFCSELNLWKENDADVTDLGIMGERYIGNVWTENTDLYHQVYKLWFEFKTDYIDRIGGMTMNERLYVFSIMNRWDQCSDDEAKNKIYLKMMAKKYSP